MAEENVKNKVEEFRGKRAEKAARELQPEAKDADEIREIFKEAKQPIKITDALFELGEGEIDIRSLSKKNRDQMEFRLYCNMLNWQRNAAQAQLDCLRLMMVILKKMGVDDITKAIADLETDLRNELNKRN